MRRTAQRKNRQSTAVRLGAVAGAVAGGCLAWLAYSLDASAARLIVVTAGAVAGALVVYVTQQGRRIAGGQERERSMTALALAGVATAGLAHELKNGLTVTHGFAALARRRADRTSDQRLIQQIDSIERETDRMIRDLRSFLYAAVETKRLGRAAPPLLPRLADFERTLTSVAGLMLPLAREREVVLEVDSAGLPKGMVDEPTFRVVLMNLLLNALHHARTTVRVSARVMKGSSGDRHVELAVADDGRGIPDEVQDRIFEPGVTLSSGGSGVGLSFSRDRALRLGGDVELVQSNQSGTRFVVRLPFHPPLSDHEEEPVSKT